MTSECNLAPVRSLETIDARFSTTRWSRVLLAGRDNSSDSDAALAEICERYWRPLYAYIRRSGHAPVDAQDLTQEFFSRLLAKQWLTAADPARGRFRSFLLGALNHFLANEWRHCQAKRRGGNLKFLSFDDVDAPHRQEQQPSKDLSPDVLYERRWALSVLENALVALRDEYEIAGEGVRFATLEPVLSGERADEGYAALASQLGLTVSGVKAAVRRLRLRFGELLRAEVGDTVNDRADIEEELRYLLNILNQTG